MVSLADFRFVIRGLTRTPGVALVAITTLAVAFAFNIAAAGLLNGLLLRPYQYPDLQQLMLVRDARPREGAHQGRPIAIADFLELRRTATAFSSLTAWRPQPLVVTNPGAEPERIEAAAVSANFFATLGVTPLLGRTFQADADQAGRDDVVVISRRLWVSRFGASPAVVGSEVALNGRRTVVSGIIRDEDCYPSGVDAWVPLVFTPTDRVERTAQTIAAVGRLAATRSETDARAQLESIANHLAGAYPLTNHQRAFDILPLRREQYEFTAPMFGFVQAAALLVLLLAAINVTNLLAARTLDRRRELVVRTLVGASRPAIVGLVVCEALALAIVATGLGTASGGAVLALVRASLPDGIARWVAGWSTMAVGRGSLVAGTGVGLATGAAIGAAVAVAALAALAEPNGSARTTRRRTLGRRMLVASEVGLAATLLLGASVMVTGLDRIKAAFDTIAPERLLRFTLTLPESRYPDAVRIGSFHASLLDALRAQSGVTSTALIRNDPASNVPSPTAALEIADLPAASPADAPRVDVQTVTADVFDVLRIGIVGGRAFAATDALGTPRVAIASLEAERRFWSGRHAVGSTIRLGTDRAPLHVVGVATDIKLNWYDPEMRPVIYVADAQAPARTTAVLVRTSGDAAAVARQVRTAVAALDDRQPISGLEPMTTTIADSLSPIRVIERLLLAGALVSALLAALGIYSVLEHWVGSRRREFGVRYALGATQPAIVWLVLREALGTAAAGATAGLAAGSALIRLAGGALLGVPAVDTGSIAGIIVATAAITAIAALTPARRAAHVDVAELLRLE
jgi:predicted permease